ncbi:MAG: FG-GAP repeat domain-containing protein [Planctomycetota bacterium]|jgi:hypothetical protein
MSTRSSLLLLSCCLFLAGPAFTQQRFAETGSMLPPLHSDIGPVEVTEPLLFDADGDGDLDAYFGNSGFGLPDRLLLNDGSGTYADPGSNILGAPTSATYAVDAGDLDGDGDLDLYLAKYLDPDVVLLNSGAGVFTATVLRPLTDERTTDVALGDLDGDGDLDAFLTLGGDSYGFGQPDLVLLNDGSGTFNALGIAPQIFQGTDTVDLGDVDGDGDLDAWVGSDALYQHYVPRLCLNNGSAVFTDAPLQIPGTILPVATLKLGDVNGDGDLDVLLGSSDFHGDRLYQNDGFGVFTDASFLLPFIARDTDTIELEDFDGDGDLDAFLAHSILENDGFGFFSTLPGNLPPIPIGLYASSGDVDGDGDRDLLIGNDHKRSQLLLNDGTAAFLDVTSSWPLAYDRAHAIQAGDLDGDGLPEVVVGSELGVNRLLLNDGVGFSLGPDLPHGFERTKDICMADFDGDQDLDVFLVNGSWSSGYNPEPDRLYLNDGAANLSDASSNLPGFVEHSRSVAVGDVDGDGDEDLLIGIYEDSQRLFLNDGNAVFTDASGQLPVTNDRSYDLVLFDIDGDLDLDAFLAHASVGYLWSNDGAGNFTDASGQLPAANGVTYAVQVGDVDGDGDLDLVTGTQGYGTKPYRLWLNDGLGGFTDFSNRMQATRDFTTESLVLADLDEDGDLDLYVGNGMFDTLLVNDGAGFFQEQGDWIPADWSITYAAAAADVDGDEDMDLLVAQESASLTYRNLSRQLSLTGLPRIGKPLSLEMRGAPGEACVLTGSTAPGLLVIAPYGTLRLSAADRFVTIPGALDAQGRKVVTAPGPVPSGLLGTTYWWQALVGTPGQLSNLQTTTFTAW